MTMANLGNYTDLNGTVSCQTLVMGKTIKLFYMAVVIVSLHEEICKAQLPLSICNRGFQYTNGSMFERNLNTVLDSFVQHTSQKGFNTTEYGQSPDQIYGLLQCRGDATVEQCNNCSQQAIAALGQDCKNASGGLIWFDLCFLRYGNYSFFGQLDIVDGWYLWNVEYVSSPGVFNATLRKLFSDLTAEAVSTSTLYASGTTTDSLSRRIYGLVQCTRDISTYDCEACLSATINYIFAASGGRRGARGLIGSCIVRYEMYPFFNLDGLPLTAGAPNPPPDYLITPSSNNTIIKCNNTVNYTTGSKFESKLNKFLENLVQQRSPDGYNPYVYDQIYGFLRCRGDATLDKCSNCTKRALTIIRQKCTNDVGGTVILDVCSLGYEIYNFLNLLAPATAPVEMSTSILDSPAPPTVPAAAPTNTVGHTPRMRITRPKRVPIILGVVGSLLLALLVCLFASWRRLKTTIFQVHEVEEDTPISEQRPVLFKMKTLLAATRNFHDDNKLGEGGFGSVFKGTTDDGKNIAVKRLSVHSMQGRKQFMNEVKLVAKIQHRNLVKLFGCCSGGSETLLVYEYLPNMSLDKILFDPNKRKHLDWQKRYIIILGIARGLLYLHQDSQPRIIHRDIKASNILLDEKLNPKISDFGLAKLFPEDESHVSTRVAGTYGYMAPEYAMQGHLSVKADVYSFGVLLLEIISGRKNTNYNLPEEMQLLLGWAWRSYERGSLTQVIDPSIFETRDEGQALRCIHVGLLCTQADSSLRPPMSTVTLMLSNSVTLPDPTKPIVMNFITENTIPTSSASASSHAPATTTSASSDASITVLVPR